MKFKLNMKTNWKPVKTTVVSRTGITIIMTENMINKESRFIKAEIQG